MNTDPNLLWKPENGPDLVYPVINGSDVTGAVSPVFGTVYPEGYEAPPCVGTDEFYRQYKITESVVAEIRAGGKGEALFEYGWPTEFDYIPEWLMTIAVKEKNQYGHKTIWQALASLVRMDPWKLIGDVMFSYALEHGELRRPECDEGNIDFIGAGAALTRVHQAQLAALRTAFGVKYGNGHPRPYQVSGVPKAIFTSYPKGDGGDEHPEAMAGHPANAAAAWAQTMLEFKMSDHIAAELKRGGMIFGLSRVAGGVHYPQTCVATFNYFADTLSCEQTS